MTTTIDTVIAIALAACAIGMLVGMWIGHREALRPFREFEKERWWFKRQAD